LIAADTLTKLGGLCLIHRGDRHAAPLFAHL
jgi:hypothetical protein